MTSPPSGRLNDEPAWALFVQAPDPLAAERLADWLYGAGPVTLDGTDLARGLQALAGIAKPSKWSDLADEVRELLDVTCADTDGVRRTQEAQDAITLGATLVGLLSAVLSAEEEDSAIRRDLIVEINRSVLEGAIVIEACPRALTSTLEATEPDPIFRLTTDRLGDSHDALS